MKDINADKLMHLPGELRYGVDCTLVAAHGGVSTPCNRTTIITDILPFTLRASSSCSNRSRRFSPRRCAMC
ncbi:MAG: hypothetical protein ABFR65_10645, partial [Pseudomonadota bacterium]